MKTLFYIYRLFALLILSSTISSCVKEEAGLPAPASKGNMPISMSLENTSVLVSDLNHSLYIFSHTKGSTEPYQMEKKVSPLQADTRLNFPNHDLIEKDYRFLFMATPGNAPEIEVLNTANTSPVAGDDWNNIRIGTLASELSVHNYYQIKDMPGTELIAKDSLQGELSRLTGQMEFRFFKIGENITDTDTINLKKVASVFDRIYKIDIRYTGFSTLLSFKDGQTPIAEANDTEGITQEILLTPNDMLGIEIPQGDLDTLAGGAKFGGKIHGLCFLPTPKKIKAVLTFYYYDTTPKCENPEEKHVPACYEQRTLQLQIPLQLTETTGLPIEPDTYTVNRAGIRCDRIIDIRVSHNADILTNWNTLYQ